MEMASFLSLPADNYSQVKNVSSNGFSRLFCGKSDINP